MPTTYTNGLKLPDLGSIDWFNAYKNNIDILDPIVGTVNGVATTYAPISHNHDASEITSGTIDIARLPPAALERLTTVADQTARYALTTSTVQLGDTVKQLDTGIMYLVVDTTKLNSADGYVEYSAGTASKALADEDGINIKTGYVSIADTQTVTSQKVWTQPQIYQSNIYLSNTSYTVGTIPTSNITSTCFFAGASNYQIGYCRSVVYKTTGQTSVELTARNKFTNGALDPNGDYRNATITANLDADGTRWIQFANSSIKNGLTPYTTDTYNIGNATNQWSSVYAQTYYYNGTAWGLDKTNVWSGINIFTDVIAYKDTVAEIGNYPASNRIKYQTFADKNSTTLGYTNFAVGTNGVTSWNVWLENKATNGVLSPTGTQVKSFMGLYIDTDMSSKLKLYGDFIPNNTSRFNIGTSTNKWKTLNGINPGALSLPINANSASFNIDTTNWTTDGSLIVYTPLLDGWIYINARNDDTNGDSFIIFDDSVSGFGTSVFGNKGLPNNGVGLLCLMMPVNKNNGINIRIKSPGIISARLYPCNGNV